MSAIQLLGQTTNDATTQVANHGICQSNESNPTHLHQKAHHPKRQHPVTPSNALGWGCLRIREKLQKSWPWEFLFCWHWPPFGTKRWHPKFSNIPDMRMKMQKKWIMFGFGIKGLKIVSSSGSTVYLWRVQKPPIPKALITSSLQTGSLDSNECIPRAPMTSIFEGKPKQWSFGFQVHIVPTKYSFSTQTNTLTLQICIYCIPPFYFQCTHILSQTHLTFPSSSSNEAPPPVLQWVTWHRNISWRVKGVRGWWCQNIRVCNKRHSHLTWRELQVYPFQARALSSVSYFLQASAMLQRGSNGFLCGNQPGQELWICTSFRWIVLICLYLINAQYHFCIARPKRDSERNSIWTGKMAKTMLLCCTINFINETTIQRRTKNSWSWNLVQNLEENNRKPFKTSRRPFLDSHERTRLSYCGGVTSANHLSCGSNTKKWDLEKDLENPYIDLQISAVYKPTSNF